MCKPFVPNWLKQLKSGIYTLDELCVASGGKAKTSVHRTVKRLGIKKIYTNKIIFRNIREVKYKWEQSFLKEDE